MSSARTPSAPRPRSRDDQGRLGIRYREDERSKIDRAAAMVSSNPTDFTRRAALAEADRILNGQQSSLAPDAMDRVLATIQEKAESVFFDAVHARRRLSGQLPESVPDVGPEVPEISARGTFSSDTVPA